jgi:hypothetical protein
VHPTTEGAPGKAEYNSQESTAMSRFPNHTLEDAPESARPLLQKIAQASPTGQPLNVHAQMAHSAAVLAGYSALRAITTEHGTFDPRVAWALNLATAGAIGNDYMIGIASRFAGVSGWSVEGIAALRDGKPTGDKSIDALTRVVREAASHSGQVADPTWQAAQQAGWTDTQLAESFSYLGLTLFTGYFLNYARTEPDV